MKKIETPNLVVNFEKTLKKPGSSSIEQALSSDDQESKFIEDYEKLNDVPLTSFTSRNVAKTLINDCFYKGAGKKKIRTFPIPISQVINENTPIKKIEHIYLHTINTDGSIVLPNLSQRTWEKSCIVTLQNRRYAQRDALKKRLTSQNPDPILGTQFMDEKQARLVHKTCAAMTKEFENPNLTRRVRIQRAELIHQGAVDFDFFEDFDIEIPDDCQKMTTPDEGDELRIFDQDLTKNLSDPGDDTGFFRRSPTPDSGPTLSSLPVDPTFTVTFNVTPTQEMFYTSSPDPGTTMILIIVTLSSFFYKPKISKTEITDKKYLLNLTEKRVHYLDKIRTPYNQKTREGGGSLLPRIGFEPTQNNLEG
jgi:hypothetical protein